MRREGVKSGKDTLYKRKNIFLLYISYPYPFHASVKSFPKRLGKIQERLGRIRAVNPSLWRTVSGKINPSGKDYPYPSHA